MSQAPFPTRAVARSGRAMLATPHAQATAAGVDVLRAGGNAVDAAVAANGVLSVVYPTSCGLGGDAFWLVYEPRSGETIAYNGSGGAAAALDGATLRERGLTHVPERGALSVTVPGAVRSWEDVLRAHGTRALDDLLGAAERYAREGFVATDVVGAYFALNEAMLRQDADAEALFFAHGCPRAGDLLHNVPLAETLAEIRAGGADAFYGGRIGAAIVQTLRRGGNPMNEDDLAAQRTQRAAPLEIEWNGCRIVAHPPNSQAGVALMALGALENDGSANDADWTHLAIEALKRAFDVRDTHFADPEAMRVPAEQFVAPAELKRMRASLDPGRAQPRVARSARGGTIAIVAVDEDGRAVSLIESLYMNFGSGLVAAGTGVFLQNRGAYFSLEPGHVNELAGRKRPLHTLSPGMLLRGGKPEFVYGTMGGDGQPQTHLQLIHNLYERGLDVQQAIDAPRFVYGRDSEAAFADSVRVESRFAPEVADSLRARGHVVQVLGAYENALGHAHAIAVDRERGTLAGGADPRADSLALGL